MRKQFLEAGRIIATHGLRGDVRIEPWCDTPETMAGLDRLYLDEGTRYLEIENARVHKSIVIVKFAGVENIDAAVPLLKRVVYIDRAQITLPEGSYFEQDLIGLTVLDADSLRSYGSLSSVLRTGANDVYGVMQGGREVLIPAIRDVVIKVDIEGGRMLIRPIKGLFNDED